MSDGEKRFDLKINGSMEVAGGIFRQVSVNGSATIHGNVDCIEFKTNGFASIKGSLKSIEGKVNGKTKINGALEADIFKVNGSCTVLGNINIKEFNIYGSVISSEDITSERINVKGEVKASGNCNADEFSSEGIFDIGGLLNSGNISITTYGKCIAKEIEGDKIDVRKGTTSVISDVIKSIFLCRDIFSAKLTSDIIEGDDIYLEYTKAKVVRGNDVKIGPGCEIDLVEYTGQFEQSEKATVIESKRI